MGRLKFNANEDDDAKFYYFFQFSKFQVDVHTTKTNNLNYICMSDPINLANSSDCHLKWFNMYSTSGQSQKGSNIVEMEPHMMNWDHLMHEDDWCFSSCWWGKIEFQRIRCRSILHPAPSSLLSVPIFIENWRIMEMYFSWPPYDIHSSRSLHQRCLFLTLTS